MFLSVSAPNVWPPVWVSYAFMRVATFRVGFYFPSQKSSLETHKSTRKPVCTQRGPCVDNPRSATRGLNAHPFSNPPSRGLLGPVPRQYVGFASSFSCLSPPSLARRANVACFMRYVVVNRSSIAESNRYLQLTTVVEAIGSRSSRSGVWLAWCCERYNSSYKR